MKDITPPEFIKNTEEVIKFFGYWPTFHDDIVEKFTYDYSKKEIRIDISSQQEKKCTVSFYCRNVSELKLINEEERYLGKTIIFEIKFLQKDKNTYFEILPSVGIYISIKCTEIIIKKVVHTLKQH